MKKNKLNQWIGVIEGVIFVFDNLYILFNEPGNGDPVWRSCNRSNGNPKVGYEFKEEANMEGVRLSSNGKLCKPYKCQLCGKYHTGHRLCKSNLFLLSLNTAHNTITNIVEYCDDAENEDDNNFDNFYYSL